MTHNRKNKVLLIIISLVLLVISSIVLLSQPKIAPDVRFITLDNKSMHMNDLQGKVVLVTFWASNCSSCLKEIPDLIHLYETYHPSGLEMIAVAMHYDRPNFVVNTRKRFNIPYAIVLDLNMSLATAFGNISLTPTTLLINPLGEIIFKKTGIVNIKEMQNLIENSLLSTHTLK